MIVSYTTGLDILKNHLEDFRRGRIRVLLLFLGAEHDRTFLESVKALAKDLDNLTGPYCLAIVFMPPPEEYPFQQFDHFGTFYGGGGLRDIAEWDSFVEEMTRNTYELARFLGIPQQHLPCLAFIDTEYPEEIATLRVHNSTLEDIYPQLRKLFSEWYAENKEVLDAYYLAASRHDYLTHSSHIKRLGREMQSERRRQTEERLRQEAVPIVEEAFSSLLAADRSLDQSKVRRFLKRLRQQPRNTQPLVSFLREHDLTIQLAGNPTTWQNFATQYQMLYPRDDFSDLYQFGPPAPADPVSRFPMNKVKSLSKNAELRHLGRRVSDGTAANKPAIDIVLAILKVFGLSA